MACTQWALSYQSPRTTLHSVSGQHKRAACDQNVQKWQATGSAAHKDHWEEKLTSTDGRSTATETRACVPCESCQCCEALPRVRQAESVWGKTRTAASSECSPVAGQQCVCRLNVLELFHEPESSGIWKASVETCVLRAALSLTMTFCFFGSFLREQELSVWADGAGRADCGRHRHPNG